MGWCSGREHRILLGTIVFVCVCECVRSHVWLWFVIVMHNYTVITPPPPLAGRTTEFTKKKKKTFCKNQRAPPLLFTPFCLQQREAQRFYDPQAALYKR